MSRQVSIVLVVHAATRWRTFHRRALLLALAKALPPSVGLLGVDRPISPDVASWKHPGRFWAGLWRLQIDADEADTVVVMPRLALHEHVACRVPGAAALNRLLLRAQLREVIAREFPRCERTVQWIYYPVQRWVWECFPGCGRIYECYDDYARSSRGELDAGRWQAELRVLRDADLTFTTARSLMDSRAPFACRTQLLPNGVPDCFFDVEPPPTPDPIDSVPHPRIGYLGNLRAIVDYPLLEEVFRRHPQWQLVVIGPIEKGVPAGALLALPNVHVLGRRPYDRVPGVLRKLDAGLVPFVRNAFTEAINPLKLYEYLAAGLPVVATRLPEIERFGNVVRLVDNEPVSFAAAIEASLSAPRSSIGAAAVAAARPFSWTSIARQWALPALQDTFGF